MFRSIISIGTLCALLAATLVFPTESYARRCGVEIPETLLSLYRTSEIIAIATFDKVEDGETVTDDENYTVVNVRSYYTVSTVLKGANTKQLVLQDEDYRYKGEDSETAELESGVDPEYEYARSDDDPSKVEPGDTVMLFLHRQEYEDENGKKIDQGLRPVGYTDGIKKLSGDGLRAYEARVNQLNVIFSSSADSRDAAITDWLVSVTEDPLTRWEGAFELLQSFQELEWMIEEEKRRAEEGETSEEPGTETGEGGHEEAENYYAERHIYARLMTDAQKQILLNTYLDGVTILRSEEEKNTRTSRGDTVLMELVKRWGDKRFAAVLNDQLRAGAGDPYYRYQVMDTIAVSLKDGGLAEIVEQYGAHLYEEDDAVIQDDAETAGDGEANGEVPAENGPVPEAVVSDSPEAAAGETKGGDKVSDKKTYGQLRTELVEKFIASVDTLLATAE